MINFRYHVVTLVAVFLALGLGVLFGASFIDQNTVTGLRRSQERLGDRNKALRDEVVALQKDSELSRAFAASSRDLLIRGSLTDQPVVVVAFDSTPGDVVRSVEDVLVKAGGRVEGSIRFTDDMDLRNPERRRQLAATLESSNSDVKSVNELLINQLTAALSSRNQGLLQRLVESGFASTQEPEGAQLKPVGELASPGSAIVVVPGDGRRELRERFTLPLVKALASQGVVTAAAERSTGSLPVVTPLRQEPSLKLVTVDGIEQPPGQAALALGLQAAFAGSFGHYGTGEGANSLLPDAQLVLS